MRDQRALEAPPVPVPMGSVTGLGVCDVWRLDLSAVQWPWLVEEIGALRRPLEEELERARAQHAVTGGEGTTEEVSAHAYELRLLARVRAQVPAAGDRRTVVVVGPAELVAILVVGAARKVVATLSEALDDVRPSDAQARERLAELAKAARAWVQIYVDCQELDAFSFDPAADPVRLR